jgi:hypothetical protein
VTWASWPGRMSDGHRTDRGSGRWPWVATHLSGCPRGLSAASLHDSCWLPRTSNPVVPPYFRVDKRAPSGTNVAPRSPAPGRATRLASSSPASWLTRPHRPASEAPLETRGNRRLPSGGWSRSCGPPFPPHRRQAGDGNEDDVERATGDLALGQAARSRRGHPALRATGARGCPRIAPLSFSRLYASVPACGENAALNFDTEGWLSEREVGWNP